MPAIISKIIGSITIVFIYQFYYEGGDTVHFFKDSTVITDALTSSPVSAYKILLVSSNENDPDINRFTRRLTFFNDEGCLLLAKVAGIINLFTFSSFLPTSILMGLLGLTGMWGFFLVLVNIEPALSKYFAISTLYMPTVFFWGSGIIKDTLVLGAMGWAVYSFYTMFFKFRKPFQSTFIFILAMYMIVTIKIYVGICLLPALLVWMILTYNHTIKSTFLKTLTKPLLLTLAIIAAVFATYKLTENNQRYSFDQIIETSQVTGLYISQVSKIVGGSVYDLGKIEYTFTGILKMIPAGINVTLFRPYLWEVTNPLMLISSLESTFFLVLTIYIIFIKTGFFRTLFLINKTPFLIACFAFSLPFAFAVGISTLNFGTLARYKLPLIPFYLSGLYYLNYLAEKNPKPKKQLA
ncbi:MAG: hypothetical protein K0R51_2598 [Cytophagaceae bacterium]|nr:hypothetical protein [Cytophagaceae bacterium]